MRARNLLTTLGAIAIACALVRGATADTRSATRSDAPPLLLLVLDASGSMRGKIERKPKMAIAREVVGDLVDALADGTDAGLIAYGHRHRDTCDDIEQVVPIAPIDKRAFKAKLAALEPKGKTPLTAASRQAIELAAGSARRATVVLISDGLETCKASPCAMVKELKASGVDFVMHVIGFDVKGLDTQELRCAAEATGGRFLEAEDADQLGAALDLATASARPPTGSVIVKPTRNGKPLESLVVVRGTGGSTLLRNRTVSRAREPIARFPYLPEGIYDIEVSPRRNRSLGKVIRRGERVMAGETLELPIDYGTGSAKVTLTHNGKPFAAQLFRVYRRGETSGKHVASEVDLRRGEVGPGIYELAMLPGSYTVRMSNRDIDGVAEVEVPLEIAAGKTAALRHDYRSGIVRLRMTRGGQPYGRTVKLHREDGNQRVLSLPAGKPKQLTIEPGRYRVEVRGRPGQVHSHAFRVEAGGEQDEVIELP